MQIQHSNTATVGSGSDTRRRLVSPTFRSQRTGTAVLLSTLEQAEADGRYYWKYELSPSGWAIGHGKLHNFYYIPAQYGITKIETLKRMGGQEGVHFAEGEAGLLRLLQKYGTFFGMRDGKPLLVNYKGPELGMTTVRVIDTIEASDDDVEQRSSPRAVLSPRANAMDEGSKADTESCSDDDDDSILDEPTLDTKSIAYRTDSSNTRQRPELEITEVQGGATSATDRILYRIPEKEWGEDNTIPYKHLENVFTDPKNHIIVGQIGFEICTVFAYCKSGKNEKDATVVLVWTTRNRRRMGYCSKIMRFEISSLKNTCRFMSGPSVSQSGRSLFENQNWKGLGEDMLAVEVKELKRTLRGKSDRSRAENEKEMTNTAVVERSASGKDNK